LLIANFNLSFLGGILPQRHQVTKTIEVLFISYYSGSKFRGSRFKVKKRWTYLPAGWQAGTSMKIRQTIKISSGSL